MDVCRGDWGGETHLDVYISWGTKKGASGWILIMASVF